MAKESSQEGVSIHAGFPNPATDTSVRGLDLHQLLVQNPVSTYLFRVRGNQWEGAGVFDGDVAIVDRALHPRPSDTVLWWDGAAGEFAISTQKRMPPDAACWGVVTASIHEFRKLAKKETK